MRFTRGFKKRAALLDEILSLVRSNATDSSKTAALTQLMKNPDLPSAVVACFAEDGTWDAAQGNFITPPNWCAVLKRLDEESQKQEGSGGCCNIPVMEAVSSIAKDRVPRTRATPERFGASRREQYHIPARVVKIVGRVPPLVKLHSLAVGQSTIRNAGLGLFANGRASEGTLLTEYGGELIGHSEAQERRRQVSFIYRPSLIST